MSEMTLNYLEKVMSDVMKALKAFAKKHDINIDEHKSTDELISDLVIKRKLLAEVVIANAMCKVLGVNLTGFEAVMHMRSVNQ